MHYVGDDETGEDSTEGGREEGLAQTERLWSTTELLFEWDLCE